MTADQAGISRRRFLQLAAVAGGSMLVPVRFPGRASAAQSPQLLLPGSRIPQFSDELPLLRTTTSSAVTLEMREFRSRMLPAGAPVPASYEGTTTWGYREPGQSDDGPYVGPLIVATRGVPTTVTYANELGTAAATHVLAYRYSTDQTLHWADPLDDDFAHMAMAPAFGSDAAGNYGGTVPAVPHLHGGEVPPELDGGPDAWFTSDGLHFGHDYYAGPGGGHNVSVYRYPNTQEAAPLWFHDHTLGATRLNVYAGLAGGYLLVDPGLQLPPTLPGPADIVPLVIQDRSFDTDGELFFHADSAAGVLWTPNPEHPYWVPEFEGDTIVVNGKVWPKKSVEAKRYRFLFLNGSNARTYEMFLTDPVTKVDGPPMWVIGTDGGYLDEPVKIDPNAPKPATQRLVMMPGERYDVIVDFNDPTWRRLNPAFSGSLVLRTIARTPFPNGAPPNGNTVGRIMKFVVGAPPAVDPSYDPDRTAAPDREPLRTGSQRIVRLADPGTGALAAGVTASLVRQLTLNEVMGMPQTVENPVTGQTTAYPGGPLEVLVNNTRYDGTRITGVTDGRYDYAPIPGSTPDGIDEVYTSEVPHEGTTELWEIVNVTADAHPIHVHLVQFQVMNRQAFDVPKYLAAYGRAFPGGGYDPMTQQPYPPGVYIPGYGPPRGYAPADNALSGGKHGGNPDISRYLRSVPTPPPAYEAGWKDTVIAYPGQVTRIVVRWAPTDGAVDASDLAFPFDPGGNDATRRRGYVWHCHIIDHEDNEMMRPTLVEPTSATRTVTDY